MKSESESSSSDEIEEVNDKFPVQMGKRKNSRIYLANRKEVEKERGVRRKKKRKENVNVAGKSFSYSGRKRERKSEKSEKNTENSHDLPSNVFTPQELLCRKPIHQQLTDSTVEFEELDETDRELIENLKSDFMGVSMNSIVTKTWQERQADLRQDWENSRTNIIFESYVSNQPFIRSGCDRCQKILDSIAIRCMTCKRHFCNDCDYVLHSLLPFHRRNLVSLEILQPLKPSEFFDQDWCLITKEICVPCFVPSKCEKCNCEGKMRLVPNSDPRLNIAVIMLEGRFDLRASGFHCMECKLFIDADKNDYIFSGFWPASTTAPISYLFSEEEVFLMWHHLRHKSPLNSENMFISTLQEISDEFGRQSIVNNPLFSRAFKEWEICQLNIKVKIKNMNTMSCPPCGKNPVMGSSDANVKLRRRTCAGKLRKSRNERESIQEETPRFGDLVIKSDKEVQEFRNRIYTKIKRSKRKEMCGGSAFKAAKIDASKKSKCDETGLLLSVCRHGLGLGAINMHEGESMTYTLFLQKIAYEMNCKFFCNDVICRYEKFARKVALAFPEYQPMNKMKGMLPRMHAKAHHWPCQILYNPHWQKGAGLTVGEEHEQVFSKMSLYGYVTKHMSKANRIDLLSAAILYWNWGKIERMPSILSNRMKKARICVTEYRKKLTSLLDSNQCEIEEFPEIFNDLQKNARINLGSRQNKNTSFDKLKRNIEGIYIQIKNVFIFISTQAESCKARTRFRGVLSKLKAKAVKLVSEINTKKESQNCPISMEDFEKGIFPWDFNSDDHEEKKSFAYLSISEKYEIVDTWMLLQRAEEEIKLCKMEMKTYLLYLVSTRSSLNKNLMFEDVSYGQKNTKFLAGKAVLSRCEIARLDKKIQECLLMFQLYSENDYYRFSQNECEYEETQDSEFDSQDVDESYYDESTGSEDSEQTDYENDSQLSDSESD